MINPTIRSYPFVGNTQCQQTANASPTVSRCCSDDASTRIKQSTRAIRFSLTGVNMMDLQRSSVPTHNQFDRVRQIHALSNFHKAIWLLRHKTTGKLAVRKEFEPRDVASGFAAREIRHLIRLSNCNNICTYLEHELNMATATGALVMDVYAYGDLWTLLEKHVSHRKPFPEGFIWHVFRWLAKALLHMQRGNPPILNDTYDWILHRDIYPRNIFLGLTFRLEPSWPKVVLGDFGSSISRAEQRQPIELRQQQNFSPLPSDPPNNKRRRRVPTRVGHCCIVQADLHP
jgi:serine/threonine protein kinase